MTHRITLAVLLIAFVAAEADAQSRQYRRRGVVLGGLAGAAIGVAIGDKGDNETAGALIGAAAGAVAGGAIGNQKDMRIQQQRRYQSTVVPTQSAPYYRHYGTHIGAGRYVPHYSEPHVYDHDPGYYAQPTLTGPSAIAPDEAMGNGVPQRNAPQPVTPDHVLAMVDAGLSDSIVILQIRRRGVSHDLTVDEIIHLHQSGVSEAVISAMQAPSGLQPVQSSGSQQTPEFRSGYSQ